MRQRYMLNTKTERVYILHEETLRQRKDMVEISEAQAENIMAGKPVSQNMGYAPTVQETPPANTEDTIAYLKRKLAIALELLNMSSPEQLPDDLTQGKVIMDDFTPPAEGESAPEAAIDVPGEKDPDIAMLEQIRIEGKGKARVEAYCLEKFGVDVDRRMRLNDLVDKAIDLRLAEVNKGQTEAAPEVSEQPDF